MKAYTQDEAMVLYSQVEAPYSRAVQGIAESGMAAEIEWCPLLHVGSSSMLRLRNLALASA